MVLALAWWLLAPAAREASEPNERAVASDTALVVLSALIGLTQGIVLVIQGRRLSLARVVVVFLAACVGAVDRDPARSAGSAPQPPWASSVRRLIWPLAFLVVVGFAEALRYTLSREH